MQFHKGPAPAELQKDVHEVRVIVITKYFHDIGMTEGTVQAYFLKRTFNYTHDILYHFFHILPVPFSLFGLASQEGTLEQLCTQQRPRRQHFSSRNILQIHPETIECSV